MMLENAVKQRLARGELVISTFVMEFASPGIAGIVAAAGADLVVLDMEHSGWSCETVKQQIAHAGGESAEGVRNAGGFARTQGQNGEREWR